MVGNNVGFHAPPGASRRLPVTTGGEGLAWSVTAKSSTPTSPAYIDFITNAHAADVMTQTATCPPPPGIREAAGRHRSRHIFALGRRSARRRRGALPRLQHASFYERTANCCRSLIGAAVAEGLRTTLQRDYGDFQKTKK